MILKIINYNAVRAECYKMLKRNYTKVLIVFGMLPLFYGLGNMMNSKAVIMEGTFSAATFGSMCWGLLGLTGVTNVVFVIIVANYFGKEKETGQLKLAVWNLCSRTKVIRSKFISVFLLILLTYIMMYLISGFVYYIFLYGPEYGTKLIDGTQDLLDCISTDLLYMIQLVVTVSLEMLFCSCYKSSTSLLLGMITSYMYMALQYIPLVKYADPLYLVELYNNSKLSTWTVLVYGIFYLILCGIILTIVERKFQQEELK